MLGPRQEVQSALFYDFSIEDHVPSEHVLRAIDGVIDLSGVRQHLSEFYSNTGRPSIDPELMMRMLLVGYIMGIRSERRLCDSVLLRHVFETVIAQCIEAGLASGQRYATDASIIAVDANRQNPRQRQIGSLKELTHRRHHARFVNIWTRWMTLLLVLPVLWFQTCGSKIYLTLRSGLPMDRRRWWPSIFCLFHELFNRYR